jgi:hypothetical protein
LIRKQTLLFLFLLEELLFENIQDTNAKLSAQLHQKNKRFVVDHSKAGFVIFNFNYTKDYEKHGRVASPNEMRHFLQSHPKFAKIDEFWSNYIDIIIQHFTGSAQVSTDRRLKIENLINELPSAPGPKEYQYLCDFVKSKTKEKAALKFANDNWCKYGMR